MQNKVPFLAITIITPMAATETKTAITIPVMATPLRTSLFFLLNRTLFPFQEFIPGSSLVSGLVREPVLTLTSFMKNYSLPSLSWINCISLG